MADVEVTVRDHVGTVVLNRPERMNAMTNQMLADMIESVRELGGREDVRAILMRGAGDRAFCAGHDLREVEQLERTNDTTEARLETGLIEALTLSPKPTIAAVKGYVRGGGNWIMASCDLVLCAEDATFALTQITFGSFVIVPMVPILRRVGRSKALDVLLSADIFGAREAKALGYVDRLFPVEGFWDTVKEYVQKIASRDPQAVKAGKEALSLLVDMDYIKGLKAMLQANLVFHLAPNREANAPMVRDLLERARHTGEQQVGRVR